MPVRYLDDHEVEWAIYEIHPQSIAGLRDAVAIPDALMDGWLLFLSRSGRRRRWPVPADWQHLSREGLGELLALASPVRVAEEDP